MPVFEPASELYLGYVPWDNSYRHMRLYPNKEQQYEGIFSHMNAKIPNTGYTFIRRNSTVKVQGKFDDLIMYNYCMYRNNSNKWIYAFVNGLQYVNENTVQFTIETDVMQTWETNYKVTSAYVERMHVLDDSLGKNIVPEPNIPVRNVVLRTQDVAIADDCKVVLQTTSKPIVIKGLLEDWSDGTAVGNEPAIGGWYNNIYSGAKYYAFPMEESGPKNQVRLWLQWLSEGGGMDGLCNMFLFPSVFLPPVGDDHGIEENTEPKMWHLLVEPPNKEEYIKEKVDYLPQNNKVFTYPYSFLRLVAPGKGVSDYRFEWFNYNTAVSHSGYFECYMPLDPDANLIMVPLGYAGCAESNYNEMFYMPFTTKLSWTNSAYDSWSAQNFLSNALTVAMAGLSLTNPVGKAASSVISGYRASTTALATAGTVTNAVSGSGKASAMGTFETGLENLGKYITDNADVLSSVAGLASTAERMVLTPEKMCGSYSGNGLYSVGAMRCSVQVMVPCIDDMRSIDTFFSMYGYQVDRLTTPNRAGRKRWNYVKTVNADFTGKVPEEDLAKINSIYNAGVTFWHDDNVGQYSNDNSIVTE